MSSYSCQARPTFLWFCFSFFILAFVSFALGSTVINMIVNSNNFGEENLTKNHIVNPILSATEALMAI